MDLTRTLVADVRRYSVDPAQRRRPWRHRCSPRRRGASAELLGGCVAGALEMAAQYAKDRVQFGEPIGSSKPSSTAAPTWWSTWRGCVGHLVRAWAIAAGEPEAPMPRRRPRCGARSGQAGHGLGLQVHGGIGFTWEHDLHLYMKRAQLSQLDYSRTQPPSPDRPGRRPAGGRAQRKRCDVKNEAPPTSPVADPGLGEAALPAASAAELLRRNAADPTVADRPAIRFDDRIVTHAEYYRESCRWANLMLASRRPDRPLHVAILLDNIPEYLFAFGGAALASGAVVGVNHTRRGEHLAHDVHHTHCVLMITEPAHEELIAPVVDELGEVLVVGGSLEDALGAQPDTDPYAEAGLEMPWALIFTSGTSAAPKAVICSQRRILVTGSRMGQMMGLGPDDIGYVVDAAVPLRTRSWSGWAPSVVFGASVGLARRFTVSGWLADIRRYGAT